MTHTLLDTKIDSVQRLYAAYGRGDVDAVLAELADDVDWAAEAAGTAVPWYGPFHGKDAVPRFFGAIADNVDVTSFDVLGYATNDTDVVATVRWSYTVRATGRSAEMLMQHWWRFADGKIVCFRGSEDSLQSAAAFGSAPLENAETVRRGYAAFARGDVSGVLALLDPGIVWYAPDELPTGGEFRGPDGVAAFFGALPEHYDELRVEPEQVSADGDRVVVEGRHRGRIRGTAFDVGFAHVWTLRAGRVTALREYLDSGRLLPLFGE